jgi:hypothetical protein
MFSLCLSFVLLSFIPMFVSQQQLCFNYTLHNECSFVVETVETTPEMQEILYTFFSLNISDTRMLPPKCRRAVLWFLCNSIFKGDCRENNLQSDLESNGISESGGCVPDQTACNQMNELCSTDVVNCTELYTSIISNKTRSCEINDLTLALSNSIKVSTCLATQNETIECCPTPYHRHSKTKECVIQCEPPITILLAKDEKLISIVSMVFVMITLLMLFFGTLPLFCTNQIFLFPRYVIIMVCFSISTYNFFFNVILLVGREEYLCGDEENYLLAVDHRIQTLSCQGLMEVSLFFRMWAFCWFFVLSLVCLSFIFRGKYKSLNVLSPSHSKNKKFQIGIWCLSISISLAYVLLNILYTQIHSDYLVFSPIVFACLPNPFVSDHLVSDIPLAIVGGIGVMMSVIAMFFGIMSSKMLFILNWEAFVSLILFFFTYLFILINLFYVSPYTTQLSLENYAICVSSNPRNTTACDINSFDDNSFWTIFCLFTIPLYTTFIVILLVIWPHRSVWLWWKNVFAHSDREKTQNKR